MHSREEKRCIEEAKQGDSLAFSKIFKKYQPVVFKMQKKYYLRDLDREDWLQEGQIVCYQSLKNYNGEKGLTFGFFFKINLERHIFSLLRKQNAKKRRADTLSSSLEEKVEQSGDAFKVSEECQTEVSIDYVYIRDRLGRFHEELSPFESEVFHRYVFGYDRDKIAEICECSEGKVKNALDRVKKKLKDYI